MKNTSAHQDEHEFLKALAEPIRLRILMLLTSGELCVCDLTDVLALPQSTISRHMSRLKSAGIVADRRDGRWVHYRLNKTEFLDGIGTFLNRLSEIDPYRDDRRKLLEHRKASACQ